MAATPGVASPHARELLSRGGSTRTARLVVAARQPAPDTGLRCTGSASAMPSSG